MMNRLFFLLALLLALASPASALKMSIWDREMQTTLGAGESSGNKFNVQLVKNYSGPVVVIFSQTDEEKRTGAFQGLQTRYDGVMKNGQLTLMPELKDDTPDPKPPANQQSSLSPAPATTPTSGTASASKAIGVTLTKLLQPFKLNVTVQTTNQSLNPSNATKDIVTEGPTPLTHSSTTGNKLEVKK